jgi:hypothetical protein
VKIKTVYEKFEYKHADFVFELQEIDMSEVYILAQVVSETENKVVFDAKKLVVETLDRALLGWTGIENEKGEIISYSKENISLLPYALKSVIVNMVIEKSTLTAEKKSS